MTKKKKTYAEIYDDIEKQSIEGMRGTVNEILNKRAKEGNFMYWVQAIDELPERLHKVYLKIKWRRKIIKDVGFYSDERKEFFAAGGTFKKKYVQWLKNDYDYLKYNF